MALLIVILIFVIDYPPIMASCPEKQEPATCDGRSFFPQFYCGDVFILETKWSCGKKNKDRCVCKYPLHRDIDDQCVRQDKCKRKWTISEVNPTRPNTHSTNAPARETHSQQTEYSEAIKLMKFLQNRDTMYLITSTANKLPYILRRYNLCLRSAYITNTNDGAYRSLTNYKVVLLLGNPISLTTKQGAAEFRVHNSGGGPLKMKLQLDENDLPDSTEVQRRYTFNVVHVEDTCLLICYGRCVKRGAKFLLFGFDANKINTTECHKKLVEVCHSELKYLVGEAGTCRRNGVQLKETPTETQQQPGENNPGVNVAHELISIESVIQFLQIYDPIHLQMMWLRGWLNTDCDCVESKFMATSDKGCERTLFCYLQSNVLTSVRTTKIQEKSMIKIGDNADFEAVKSNNTISIFVRAIQGLVPTEDASSDIFRDFHVLTADSGCLLLSRGVSEHGKHLCLLWGLSRNEVNESTICYKYMNFVCVKMYDITKTDNPCDYYHDTEALGEEASIE
ncbi:uncharacterized protein LOC119179822 isoform X2 [Rhipicephalus microplus]|uniref:uncharacterized protein LOC119179822 isoform X2 n=1 Tax=Rhipicephalus microplus TaxID=6941 RepID=UPI003F6ACC30